MKTLTIKDLTRNEALDAQAMSGVRGGHGTSKPSYYSSSYYDLSKSDSSLTAFQNIGQRQEVFNANGNNVAFADDIHSTVNPVQKASNNVIRL